MDGRGTYALIDAIFLLAAVVVAIVASIVASRRSVARHGTRGARRWLRTTLVTGVVVGVMLIVMTIVFDNVIVGLRIVAYDPALISGLHIGFVPVEDLAYAIAAVILLPSLAVLFGPRQRRAGGSGLRPADQAGPRRGEGAS